jgi:hypothetical protein
MRTIPRRSLCWLGGLLLAVLGLTLGLAEMTTAGVADQPVRRSEGEARQEEHGTPGCALRTGSCFVAEPVSVAGRSLSSGGRVLPVVAHADDSSPLRVIRERTGANDRLLGDPGVDVRRELADMATALRWHHGRPDGLPPGS